jgi:superfamily I DNA and RNA helicase
VDEAQDFPQEFFPLLYRLAKGSKPIYWAYDELQRLASLEIPDPAELFGMSATGEPLVSLESVEEDGMDRDLVLSKSYRCPRDILMLAHGLGLGIHNPRGAVQMLGDQTSWQAVGYELREGILAIKAPTTSQRACESHRLL